MTFQEPSQLGVHIIGNDHCFFPNSTSSQSWVIKRKLNGCSFLLTVRLETYGGGGGGRVELVRGEEEPGHAKSWRDFFGTDVMMFIPPFDLGRGSLRKALGLDSIWKSRALWHAHLGPRSPLLALLGHGCLHGESQPTAWTPVLRPL